MSSSSHDIINFAVQFFHFLTNGEVEGILDSKIFARSVIDLVRICTAPATKVVNEEGESALIELLFEICTKIRLDPDILPAWFYPERGPAQRSSSAQDARRSQFPLFYLLVDYVHYDGPTGDFARTALLYLTETAPRSRPLEKWMMESDLAPQMASGLSALYGRLSRSSHSINIASLPILSFSDVSEFMASEKSPEDADLDMRAFLSYLAFWQDTLTHCKSLEVRDTLLDSFQVLFVEQLLYPSLLESSDVEGGSTAAVILHLCRLLDAIEQPQLVRRMLNYLFASKAQPLPKSERARQRMSLSRRKSMEQLASLAQLADNPSPELFSLLDLIVFSLRSSHFQTVTSSLKLVTVLLKRHHPYVKHQLFPLTPLEVGARQNLNELNHVMMTLFDYAGAISQVKTLDSSYQAALADAQMMMEQHSCLLDEDLQITPEKCVMAVSPDCKVLEQMHTLLESWFANDTLVNLELTGTFAGLSACGDILMRTWLSPSEPTEKSLVTVLGQLIQQVVMWRSQFVEWDAFYSVQKVEISSEDEIRRPSDDDNKFAQRSPSQVADEVQQRHSRWSESGSTRSVSSDALSAALLETRIPVGPLPDEGHTLKQSLRHILTQAIILQEFILELAATLQIRATLFNEVDLS